MTSDKTADYVIIGGGSAGCVLASRLSEDPGTKVILVEAGGSGDGFFVKMPAGTVKLMGNPDYDWCLKTEPDPSIGGRVMQWGAGKGLGGSSTINGQVYIRGQRSDYDAWADAGCTGWSFDDIYPYFLKSETYHGAANQSHGRHGPLSVSPIRSPQKLSAIVKHSFGNYGLPVLDDYCAGDQHGVFDVLATQKNGQRCSVARAFLDGARHRKNLDILTDCICDRINFDGDRAVGIEVVHGGERKSIRANAEVILSAGTAHSPAILMRSGVGAADALLEHGVDCRVHLPGVGQNLREHPTISVSKLVDIPTVGSQLDMFHLTLSMAKYLFTRSGPLTTPAVQVMAGIKTEKALDDPDILLSFIPIAFAYNEAGEPEVEKRPSFSFGFHASRPYSRGEIRLRDSDPTSPPVIDHRLLGDERDALAMAKGCAIVEEVCNTRPLADHIVGALKPAPVPHTIEGWLDHVKQNASIGYHMIGTCKMGPAGDCAAVVDSQLRVHGVSGLRVADASVMPSPVTANTNAPTVMIAEKAAELIRS